MHNRLFNKALQQLIQEIIKITECERQAIMAIFYTIKLLKHKNLIELANS